MIFTQEQINEIIHRLALLGVKDTQLPVADKPYRGDEIIAVVQGIENKKITIDDIADYLYDVNPYTEGNGIKIEDKKISTDVSFSDGQSVSGYTFNLDGKDNIASYTIKEATESNNGVINLTKIKELSKEVTDESLRVNAFVKDVKIGETSLVNNQEAKIPVATENVLGVVNILNTLVQSSNKVPTSTAVYNAIKKAIDDLINGAPNTYDTLKEIADYIEQHQEVVDALNKAIGSKADRSEMINSLNTQREEFENKVKEIKDLCTSEDSNIMALIVKLHASISVSVSPTIIEKGVNTNVNISTSASFDGSNLTYTTLVDGSPISNPYSLNDSKTFNVAINIDNANPKVVYSTTKNVTVNAYYPKYYGRSSTLNPSSADILAFTKQAISASVVNNNVTLNSSTSDYLWLCVPSTMTINSVTSNGFAVPMEAYITVAVSGKGNYKCYRSTNQINAGDITFNVS